MLLDFDRLHGTWVTDERFKGSYGRIAFRDERDAHYFWVRWIKHGGKSGGGDSASCEPVTHIRVLSVAPEPWYKQCMHCGEYAVPLSVEDRPKRIQKEIP